MKILPFLFQPLYLIFKNVYVRKDLQDCIDQPSLGHNMIRNTIKSQRFPKSNSKPWIGRSMMTDLRMSRSGYR